MYERMLNKEAKPSLIDMYSVIGNDGTRLLKELDEFLRSSYDIVSEIKFPFGSNYGWGIKYSHKAKHLCYMFPENGAFTVTIQIGKKELPKLNKKMSSFCQKTKELWEHRYPCGEGGWLHYRVLNVHELEDIKELIRIKKNPTR
ncbi:MAG: DUF3788 domain-containing protein [Candidatus Bathyarchaeota archaeon]|nr:DUF3788 domain-containing protein [Candidatus Bathyarchaeota archaeon]